LVATCAKIVAFGISCHHIDDANRKRASSLSSFHFL
jgi:hypothetical protein